MADTAVYQLPSNSFFAELLDHEKFLDKYEHNLRGQVQVTRYVQETGQYIEVWDQKYLPKMNQEGITAVISFLRTVCDKIMSITNFDEDMLNKMVYQNIQDLTDRLVENWYNYGFSSIADVGEINIVGRNFIIAQIMRSKDGMTLKAITANTVINENKTMNQPAPVADTLSRPGASGVLGRLGVKI